MKTFLSGLMVMWATAIGFAQVIASPPFIISQPTNKMVSVGSAATFAVVAVGAPPLSYQWRFNGVIIARAASAVLTLTNVQISNAGSYSVRVINPYGSRISSNAVLMVNRVPVANSQTVALDEDASVSITLTGSDADGNPLTCAILSGPTHGALSGTLPNLVYRSFTNYFGPDSFTFRVNDGLVDSAVATVSINVLSVNDPPVARASVSPLVGFPTVTNLIVIALDGTNAQVILNGSASSDVENDPLSYAWLDGTNLLSTSAVTTNLLGVATHEINLFVSDGSDTGHTALPLEVVSPADSVGIIIVLAEDSSLARRDKRPLVASLKAAAASLERGDRIPGVNQLQAFQNKVRVQIAPSDPALAQQLLEAAQVILDVLDK